ncbi:MAG: hypothetical protein P8P83_04845 [Rickettsiaceae bacterium]|nr:hypothetical protein [Rickettsiaceae bacterium]
MNIHNNIAICNLNTPSFIPILGCSNKNNQNKEYILIKLLNSIGITDNTNIAKDNVLIVGSDAQCNYEAAKVIQKALVSNNINTNIIEAANFLALPRYKQKNPDTINIVLYHTDQVSIADLSVLKKLTTTQILFKVRGLHFKGMGEGIHCSVFAKLFTKTLGIKQKNAVALGFVASLYGKEFCVINPDNICKRILENGEW